MPESLGDVGAPAAAKETLRGSEDARHHLDAMQRIAAKFTRSDLWTALLRLLCSSNESYFLVSAFKTTLIHQLGRLLSFARGIYTMK